jgi:pimeloyl-ACP methyl ester carboxylesterase
LAGGLACLGAAAAWNVWRARRAEQDNPPCGSFIEVAGQRLHYLSAGNGSPVILLHGNGAMSQDFEISGLIGALGRNHKVIAFDRPGFGYSPWEPASRANASKQARVLVQALHSLGIRRPVIVGHSWGTLAALALALEAPEEIAGLVLLGGYYFPTARADVPLLSAPALPLVGGLLAYTLAPLATRALLPALLKAMFAPRAVPKRFSREFPLGLALRPRQLRASAQETAAMILEAARLSPHYEEIRTPVTILAGDEDKVANVARQSIELYRCLPNATIRVLPGLGHMLHYFAQEEIAEAVRIMAATGAAKVA